MAALIKNDAVEILEIAEEARTTFKLNSPSFIVESIYVEFFIEFIRKIRPRKNENIIPIVQRRFEKPLENLILQICRIMDRQKADGSAIWGLISERRIILRRHHKQYNQQIPGKSPKGIDPKIWSDYNHWLIASTLWEGFKQSLEPGFTIVIPEGSDDPVGLLLRPEITPLWGMWQAFNELGRPVLALGNDQSGDCVHVRPYASWVRYEELAKGK